MLEKRTLTIALVGDHPDIKGWKDALVVALKEIQEEYPDESLDLRFIQTLNPALAPFLSVGSLGAQTVDLILCREQLLSSLADITVMVDSGIKNETLKRHVQRMELKTKSLVFWSPTNDEVVVKPIPKEEIGIRPGSMYLVCCLKMLASCLYFLCISDNITVYNEE